MCRSRPLRMKPVRSTRARPSTRGWHLSTQTTRSAPTITRTAARVFLLLSDIRVASDTRFVVCNLSFSSNYPCIGSFVFNRELSPFRLLRARRPLSCPSGSLSYLFQQFPHALRRRAAGYVHGMTPPPLYAAVWLPCSAAGRRNRHPRRGRRHTRSAPELHARAG
jgi:hypothetical protein